jgi:hypothetical protein
MTMLIARNMVGAPTVATHSPPLPAALPAAPPAAATAVSTANPTTVPISDALSPREATDVMMSEVVVEAELVEISGHPTGDHRHRRGHQGRHPKE